MQYKQRVLGVSGVSGGLCFMPRWSGTELLRSKQMNFNFLMDVREFVGKLSLEDIYITKKKGKHPGVLKTYSCQGYGFCKGFVGQFRVTTFLSE